MSEETLKTNHLAANSEWPQIKYWNPKEITFARACELTNKLAAALDGDEEKEWLMELLAGFSVPAPEATCNYHEACALSCLSEIYKHTMGCQNAMADYLIKRGWADDREAVA